MRRRFCAALFAVLILPLAACGQNAAPVQLRRDGVQTSDPVCADGLDHRQHACGVRVGDGTAQWCRVVRPPLYIGRDSEAQVTALLGFFDNK